MTAASERAAGQVRRRFLHVPNDPSPWIAWCRACSWQRSYPTWQVAFHAATQHVQHWRDKETVRKVESGEVPF